MASKEYTWVDGPFPLVSTKGWESTDGNEHGAIEAAVQMSRAHNVLIRGLNSIYLQGPYVKKPEDIKDFLFFCSCWVIMTHHHHHVEETHFFPDLAKMSGKEHIMDVNLKQHEAFHDGLEAFEKYCESTTVDKYSWEDLKALIDGFIPPLMKHFEEEIPTILALRDFDSDKVREVWARTDKAAIDMSGVDMARVVMPCALGCCDRSFEDGLHKDFPPVPFFIPWMVDWVWARKHRGAWRFLPCTFKGYPRPLAFTKETAEAA